MPPTLEGLDAQAYSGTGWYGDRYGIDWGNLEVVWPSGVFEPDEPWVRDSLEVWRDKTFEGLFTYPSGGIEGRLHSYTPMSISATYVRNGDQLSALQDLYSLLVHTSATHSAAEGLNSPQRWGWSAGDETQPHGEFAGKYLTLLRDMLAHEQGDDLHIAGTLSPVWSEPDERIEFSGGTDFGALEYTMSFRDDGARLQLSPPTERAPETIVVGVPEGVRVGRVTVDGRPWGDIDGDRIRIPAPEDDTVVEIDWRPGRAGDADQLSYARAVDDFLANYEKMLSPLDPLIGDARVKRPSVMAGEPVRLSATLDIRGGAGYLDQQPVAVVDGTPAEHGFEEVARGIGFDAPDGIVSFRPHRGGSSDLRYETVLCEPGRHDLDVTLGLQSAGGARVNVRRRPPSAPAPEADFTLSSTTRRLDSGESTQVTGRFTNHGCHAASGLSVDLDVPDGWSAELDSAPSEVVAPSESTEVSWTLRAPVDVGAAAAEVTLEAKATYGWEGRTSGTATADLPLVVFSPVDEPNRTQASTEAWFGQLGERFAIHAGGQDLWRSRDQFGTIYRPYENTPRTVVTTKVERQGATGPWAKAGIVMRNDLSAPGSRGYAIVATTPENGWSFQWDADGDGLLDGQSQTGLVSYPSWLRLERDGTTVTGSYSLDGETWKEIGSATIEETAAVADVGLFASAVNANNPGAISEVDFQGFDIEHPFEECEPFGDAPAVLRTNPPGTARLEMNSPTRVSATIVNAGCEPLTDVALDLEVPDDWTVAAETQTSFEAIEPYEARSVTWTLTPGAPPEDEPVVSSTVTVRACYDLPEEPDAEISRDLEVAIFRPVQPPYETFADTEAAFGQAGDSFAIHAGGVDMWRARDEFGTIYLPGEGTSSTVTQTRLVSQTRSAPWARAGIVMRNDLSADSNGYAMVAATPDNGLVFQWDAAGNGQLNTSRGIQPSRYPVWLRLEREGTTVTGSFSTDNQSWIEIGSAAIPQLADSGDVGLFASAANANHPGAITEVRFQGFTVAHPQLRLARDCLSACGSCPSSTGIPIG